MFMMCFSHYSGNGNGFVLLVLLTYLDGDGYDSDMVYGLVSRLVGNSHIIDLTVYSINEDIFLTTGPLGLSTLTFGFDRSVWTSDCGVFCWSGFFLFFLLSLHFPLFCKFCFDYM